MFLVAGVGLWIGGKFLFNLHHYFLLSHVAPATISEWKVEELRAGKFTICANFKFQVGETEFYQHFKFSKPVYQNPYLAQALIKDWKDESWQVWYNPKNPEITSLQKSFPIKTGVYFALCLGMLLYFSWLRIYVQRMGTIDSH